MIVGAITSLLILHLAIKHVMAVENPLKLYKYSLDCIHTNFDNETSEIVYRIYPHSFNDMFPPRYSGLYNLFYIGIPAEKEIDLSFLKIRKIPVKLASKMTNVQVLNLSNIYRLKIDEEWFKYFYSNLRELSIFNYELKDRDFEIIRKIQSLEKLSIGGNVNIDVSSDNFIAILKNLKYLDVSRCYLNFKALETVLKYGENLEYLNFNGNNLSKFNSNLELRNNLDCLSPKRIQTANLFETKLSEKIQSKKLKGLDLSYCNIDSEEFIRSIFDINGLEKLNLSVNHLNFDFTEIVKGKTSTSLKELIVSYAHINILKNLEYLTNFEALEILDISRNNFKNSIQKVKLGCSKNSLKQISANNCELSHSILKELTDCPNLEILEVSSNNFGNIRNGFRFGRCSSSLRNINIRNSKLTHLGLRAVTACSNLEKLDVSLNNFENLTSESVLTSSKDTLKELNISNTKLDYQGLEVFTGFCQIQKLISENNNFANIPEDFSFGLLRNSLIELNVMNCKMKAKGLEAITKCNKITHLDARSNDFEDLTSDFTFGTLRNSLKKLELPHSNLNHHGLQASTDCVYLENLNVSGNNFETLTSSFSFGRSKFSLKHIDIWGCFLSDCNFLKEITDCSELTSLNISSNFFGNIPENFSFGCSKDSLVFLNMNTCELNSYGLKAITECLKLEKLLLFNNNFLSVPENFTFGQLKYSLKSLDISNCILNYNCLNATSHFRKLEYLNILNIHFIDQERDIRDIFNYLRNKIKDFYH